MEELPRNNICILDSEDISSTMVNHLEVHTTEENSQHNTKAEELDEDELDDEGPFPIGILILGFFLFFLFFSYLLILFQWIFSKYVWLREKSRLQPYFIIILKNVMFFQNHIW